MGKIKAPVDKRLMLSRMSENMLYFGKVCIPRMFQVKSPVFHFEIARALQDEHLRNLNIIAPRGHAKSSLVACVYVLWKIFNRPGPHFVVLVSKNRDHAVKLLTTIKDVLNYSLQFRYYYGYHGMFNAQIWKEGEITLDNGTMITTRGTGQQVIGLKHVHQRPTDIILDDPEDLENTKTSERMEYNLSWFLRSLYPTRDPNNCKVVVIGTPQHERCMVFTLKEMEGWKTFHYSACDETFSSSIWPEWWPVERLLEEKSNLESIGRVSMFYSEYMCQVIGSETQLFKEKYFRYYDGWIQRNRHNEQFLHVKSINGVLFDTPRILPVNVYMGVDPASSIASTADYTTIVPIAVDNDDNRYVLPYFRGRVTPLDVGTKVVEYYDRYLPIRSRIESTGYQDMLRQYVMRQRHIPGFEIGESPRTAKSLRLESMQPFFASGKVYMMQSASELRDELLLYPKGKHDDLLDGLYYAMKNVFSATHEVPSPQEKLPESLKYWLLEYDDQETLDIEEEEPIY